MSLREDIENKYSYSLYEEYGDSGVTEEDSQDIIDTHQLPKIINKILDAVVEAGNFLPYSDPAPGQQSFYNNAIGDYQGEINKLRPES